MSDYVVYDVSYLQNLLSVLKTAIGNSTNIGIIIFGIILSVCIVTVVVKKFARVR